MWAYGPVNKEKKQIYGLLQAIEHLKKRGLTGVGVIREYHARQVALLMLRVRSLADMTPGASTEGTVLATGRGSHRRSGHRDGDRWSGGAIGNERGRGPCSAFRFLGRPFEAECRSPGPSGWGSDRPRRRRGGGNDGDGNGDGCPCGRDGDGGDDRGRRACLRGHGEDGDGGGGYDARPDGCGGGGDGDGGGTSAREVLAEVALAAEVEVPAPEAPIGVKEPASAVATEGEVAAGILAPPPASEAVAPSGGPVAALTAAGAQAPEPSASPAASGMMEPVSMAASRSALASASAASVPKAWRGPVLRWSYREDPLRHLFTLDDAAEWNKWQAVQGSLANARATLSSLLGELDSVVLPCSQALQECSRGKSDFLRLERGLWERFNLERQWTRELTM
ncbi:uncharacterized protein LOC111258316 [Setaria italica]|uniref:uncharacterized protein LOC111258316 n=1 Tax=Setaria italica TaxID=4555 RepID=UPI000BE511B1|nr:uncharacterized protein LOC111258316 [Setaria italica]